MRKMIVVIVFVSLLVVRARPRPPAVKHSVDKLPGHQPNQKTVGFHRYAIHWRPNNPSEPPTDHCDVIELSNVPRSGSTWFLNVLMSSFGNTTRVIAHHSPFFDRRLYHLDTLDDDEHLCRLVLTRNPLDTFVSFSKQFAHYKMNYTTFLDKWTHHYASYVDDAAAFFVAYEHLAVDPRGALGPWWFPRLEQGLKTWGHKQWSNDREEDNKPTFGYTL